MKSLRLITTLLGCFAIFVYFLTKWLTKTFGSITVEQIIWNLFNGAQGADVVIYKSAFKFIFRAVLGFLIWSFIVYKADSLVRLAVFIVSHPRKALRLLLVYIRKWAGHLKYSYIIFILFIVSISAVSYQIHRLDRKVKLFNFASTFLVDPSQDFIAKNYTIPANEEINFGNKRDLVVVLGESLETSFYDSKISKTPLKGKIMEQHNESVHFNNLVMANNSSWTVAAMVGWHFGLPLKLPAFLDGNEYHSKRGFLPGAKSIFEVLRDNGYKTVVVMGSYATFSGKGTLFKTHGNFKVYDRQYFESHGWELAAYAGTGWGFNDKFILARAQEIYEKLKQEKQPFVLFVETVDTHMPDGYAPKETIKFGDIRDAYAELDRNLSGFIDFIQNTESSNTALAVIGDHYFMGKPKYLQQAKRRIYNLFWTEKYKNIPYKKDRYLTALDIAPTLLELAGAKWPSERFGLGVSAFSAKPTLVEKFGLERLNRELGSKSSFYQQFY
jgi:phosphoglycerol transferase